MAQKIVRILKARQDNIAECSILYMNGHDNFAWLLLWLQQGSDQRNGSFYLDFLYKGKRQDHKQPT